MITSKSEKDDELLGFEVGTGCITKPFVPKLLVAKVKAIISRAHITEVIHHEENSFDDLS